MDTGREEAVGQEAGSSEMSSETGGSEKRSGDSPEAASISVTDGDEKDERRDDVSDPQKRDDQRKGQEQKSSNPVLSKKARLERLKERRVSHGEIYKFGASHRTPILLLYSMKLVS